jgi:hypothetical protein
MRLRTGARAWPSVSTWLSIICVCAGAGAWSSPLAAAGADAEQLIRDGIELRRRGDDATALQKFQQALQLDHSPRALTQVGLAEQALGRWVAAYEHLTRSLEATDDPWVTKNRSTISKALDIVDDHVGKLEILGGTSGAEVRVDQILRGTLPLGHAVPVSTGTIIVDLTAPGFIPIQRTTIVRPRETTRESFGPLTPVLAKGAPAAGATAANSEPPAARRQAPAPEVPAAAPTPAVPAPSGDGATAEDSAGARTGSFQSKAKWVAWGLGGAALALGIVELVREGSAGDNFNAGCDVSALGKIETSPGSTKTLSQCQDLKSQVDSNYRLEVIGLVGAGVLVGAGLVLWLTEPARTGPTIGTTNGPADGRKAAALSCSPGLAGRNRPWVGCALRF